MINTMWYLFLLKGVELIETCLFILRKKNNQASFLHLYHHISTLFICYYFCIYVGNGMLIISPTLNCLVHIVMYTYYTLASFGPTIQRKLTFIKKSITIIQLVSEDFCAISILSY